MTDRCAIAKLIIAPKAKTPARNSRSCGTVNAKASTAAIEIAT